MPRLFFAGAIGDIQRLQVQYTSECKLPNERGKEKVWRGLFGSKAKSLSPKQSVKLKCQIWFKIKISKKIAKKGLDASSLWHNMKNKWLDGREFQNCVIHANW